MKVLEKYLLSLLFLLCSGILLTISLGYSSYAKDQSSTTGAASPSAASSTIAASFRQPDGIGGEKARGKKDQFQGLGSSYSFEPWMLMLFGLTLLTVTTGLRVKHSRHPKYEKS